MGPMRPLQTITPPPNGGFDVSSLVKAINSMQKPDFSPLMVAIDELSRKVERLENAPKPEPVDLSGIYAAIKRISETKPEPCGKSVETVKIVQQIPSYVQKLAYACAASCALSLAAAVLAFMK